MNTWHTHKISVISLILLITGAIDSVRNLPASAWFGSSLIFFFLLSAVVFLIPVALVAAELSSTWSNEEGGVYTWVKHAFGEKTAFFAIWLQWVNTLVWYPTMLLFIAGIIAYLINPALAHNRFYLIGVILTVYWSLTLLGLRGLRASAVFAGFCAILGMILPMFLLIVMGLIWLINGHPLAIQFDLAHLIPAWRDSQSWVSLTAIMTSFLGMELAAVHVRQIDNPQRNFPRAMLSSVILILFTMIFGSLAIAFVLPKENINLVDGVMQTFQAFFAAYHLSGIMPLVMALLLLGSLGGMINWIISPAKGLLQAADHGFLPVWLYQKNRYQVASRILLLQAVLVTLLCGIFLFVPSVNAIYWLFSDLSTELYVMMYVFMFVAGWRLKATLPATQKSFQIPGGKLGYYFTCTLGLVGCVVTLIVGFIPPEQSVSIGGAERFRLIFSCGIIAMLLPSFFLYFRKVLQDKKKLN